MTLIERHIELVRAVNEARTDAERQEAASVLRGFREALRCCFDSAGVGRMLMEADQFYMDQGIDRPMCCGVFIDWEPTHAA